ncbi:MAG: hypothetical protein M3Q03_01595 [Chloroflexota bacterium]|nr:hypothetical protein [Chloroflexota bacterium]
MDEQSFDTFAKAVAGGTSRRGALKTLVAGIVAGLGGMAVRGTAAKEKAAQGSDSCPPETPRLCPTTCGLTCAGCCEDNDCPDGEACHNGSCGTCDATGEPCTPGSCCSGNGCVEVAKGEYGCVACHCSIQGADCTTLNGYDGTCDRCFCQSDLG